MAKQASPRRSFLGSVFSAGAVLWVATSGLAGAVVAACNPVAKYGGPPPDDVPKYGGPRPDDVPTTKYGGPATVAPVDTATDGGGGAAPSTASSSSSVAHSAPPPPPPPLPVAPKYGHPKPIVTKYGGPPAKPKYGGPPLKTKYGGPF